MAQNEEPKGIMAKIMKNNENIEKSKENNSKLPLITDAVQICIVVDDAYKYIKTYSDNYGVGPWNIFTFDNQIDHQQLHGKPVECNAIIAMCDLPSINLEIVQPLDEKSHYYKFLQEHGPGLHHIQFTWSKDSKEVKELLDKRGNEIVMSGTFQDSGNTFHYVDCSKDLGLTIEFLEMNPNSILDGNLPIKITDVYPKTE